MQTVLSNLFRTLDEAGIRFLLIGGWAVGHYGVTRLTVDIDVMVCKADERRIREVMRGLGYTLAFRNDLFAKFEHASNWPEVDALFLGAETGEKLFASALSIEFDGASVQIPALLHLIAMKLHAMKNNPTRAFKDLPDIVAMIRSNAIDHATDEFQAWCLRFGHANLLEQINEALKNG
jgi:predicted nucleotidyltransferase